MFIPSKSTADCVRYYYLTKKGEMFKQVARKASFKRRKFIKPGVSGPFISPSPTHTYLLSFHSLCHTPKHTHTHTHTPGVVRPDTAHSGKTGC